MKKTLLTTLSILLFLLVIAQPKPKQKQPGQSEMDKAMEDAMKGMSKEDQDAMKKMMGSVMPEMMQNSNKMAFYPEFTSNAQLIPKKEIIKINALPKKALTQAGISEYAGNLYNKIVTKGNAAEIAIAKKIIAQSPKANDVSDAAILAMLQGHAQAAMALSMKAVQLAPANPSYQNNMASLLTQYGYPEQAVPVLQKLRNDFPENSTVLNNLAHAWLGLGEIDSAKSIIKKTGGLNPYHPESKQTEGVIEETTGNPEKAAEDYEESMENAINPFSEQLIKNSKGRSNPAKLDYEKLKKSITIYEYFRKDWIKIPALSDNVSGYEKDMQIKNGYSKMFEDLESKIDALKDASQEEINALMDKTDDENAFAAVMMKESMKGINVMSKSAVVVQLVLQNYIGDWSVNYVKENIELKNRIDAASAEMTKSGKNDKCPDFDNKNNQFLSYANPIIREFHERKIEEFRIWLNTFCTWVWYLTGNPKNTMMTQCIAWTAALEGFYKNAIEDQRAIARSCVKQNGDGTEQVFTPEIPNFGCPTLIRMPVGSDWQELSNAAKNFDNNKYAIKKTEQPVPNHTIAYGADHTSIAEPGLDPFIKSANGSMTPGISEPALSTAGQLMEILKKYNERRSIDFKLGISSPDGAAEYVAGDIRRVLEEARQREAQNKAQGDWVREFMKNKIEQQRAAEAKKTSWVREYMKSKLAYSKTDDYKRDIENALSEKIKKLQKSKLAHELLNKMMSADCNNLKTSKQIQKELFEKGMMEAGEDMNVLREKGLSPSLSSGLQAPGTFTPQKGLFQ